MTASIWKQGTVVADAIAEAVAVDQYFTASAGQTVFDITNFVYTPGAGTLLVYKNGVLLTITTHYTETSSTRVTLTSGAAAGDRIALVLSAALNFADATPAAYAAQARASADAAAYFAGLVSNAIDYLEFQSQAAKLGYWDELIGPATQTGYLFLPTQTNSVSVGSHYVLYFDNPNWSVDPRLRIYESPGVSKYFTMYRRDLSTKSPSTTIPLGLMATGYYNLLITEEDSGSGGRIEVMELVYDSSVPTYSDINVIRQQILGVI